MDKGTFVDVSRAHDETLADLIKLYKEEVTDKRPGEASRIAEHARLDRFLREERELCSYAVIHLRPEHFIEYKERRLTQTARRGRDGGRGQYKAEEFKPKLRRDGKPRANAAKPKSPPKPSKVLSSGTVRRELTLLKNVIGHSKRRLNLSFNPVNSEDVKRPADADEREIRLNQREIQRLLDECQKAKNPWVAPMVEFAFETGARRGSILRLMWVDVNLEARTVVLRRVKNSRKPDEKRHIRIGLTARAVEILASLPEANEQEGTVFKVSANAFKSAYERARKRAGLEHFRLHDARHERTSSLVEAGWEIPEVMAQTGHLDPKSMLRYTNLRPHYLADKLAVLQPTVGRSTPQEPTDSSRSSPCPTVMDKA